MGIEKIDDDLSLHLYKGKELKAVVHLGKLFLSTVYPTELSGYKEVTFPPYFIGIHIRRRRIKEEEDCKVNPEHTNNERRSEDSIMSDTADPHEITLGSAHLRPHQCEAITKTTGKRCKANAHNKFQGRWCCGNHLPYNDKEKQGGLKWVT